MQEDLPDAGAIDALAHARHGDPFALLGPHLVAGGTAVRAFLPDADSVDVIERDTGFVLGSLRKLDFDGFWSGQAAHCRRRIDHRNRGSV
jgi:1,4-alpha-glucan branching enzyme